MARRIPSPNVGMKLGCTTQATASPASRATWSGRTTAPCSTRFFLDNNVYFFTDGKTASFQTTTPPAYTKTSYSLSQWQNIGEDVHSLNQDPMFTNPAADDYTLQPGSPAFQLGFVPFDYTQAGRTTSGRFTASQPPPAFPLQLMQTF